MRIEKPRYFYSYMNPNINHNVQMINALLQYEKIYGESLLKYLICNNFLIAYSLRNCVKNGIRQARFT